MNLPNFLDISRRLPTSEHAKDFRIYSNQVTERANFPAKQMHVLEKNPRFFLLYKPGRYLAAEFHERKREVQDVMT